MSNSVQTDSTAEKAVTAEKPPFLRWWVIVLIILAAPMIITLLSVPFSIIMAVLGLVFGIAVAGISLVGAGVASLISVPFIITTSVGSAVLAGGIGLMSLGFGILFLIATTQLIRVVFSGLRFLWKRLARREYGYDGRAVNGQQQ